MTRPGELRVTGAFFLLIASICYLCRYICAAAIYPSIAAIHPGGDAVLSYDRFSEALNQAQFTPTILAAAAAAISFGFFFASAIYVILPILPQEQADDTTADS